jgi:hypothetical protein
VIVLLRWTWGMETWWQYVAAVVGSVVLAVAAYGLVEQPVRRHPLKWWWETGLALLAVVGLWLGIDALHHQFRGKLFLGKDADPVPLSERVQALNPLIPGTGITTDCSVPIDKPYDATTRPNYDKCRRPGVPGATEIFLIGDSHAQHLLPMLDAATARTGQSITYAAMGACLIDAQLTVTWPWQKERYESCREFSAGEMERSLQRLSPGDIVMVSLFLNNYLSSSDVEGRGFGPPVYLGDRRLRISEVRQAWVAGMRAYAERLAAKGVQLLLVLDNPSLTREPVACQDPAVSSCAGDPATTARMRRTLQGLLGQVAAGLPNVHVFDPTPYLVGPDGRVVYRRPDGTPLYADSHHLSVSGSRSLAAPFERFLQQQGLTSPRPTASSSP